MQMWIGRRQLVLAAACTGIAWWIVAEPQHAVAQTRFGEFALFQPGSGGVVGWVVSNPDRTVEWWAYIEGSYEWADTTSTPQDRWKLEAERIGDPLTSSFENWKTSVLLRSIAVGKRIVFQNHSVVETAVDN